MKTAPAKDPAEPLKITLLGFAEARSKLLDVAAFLDRCERYGEAGDVRHDAIRAALAILTDGETDRTRRILEALSDPTTEPAAASHGKGAIGVWPNLQRPD